MKLVYEVNGNEQDLSISAPLESHVLSGIQLMSSIAKGLADQHGVPLSDVTLRFVEG